MATDVLLTGGSGLLALNWAIAIRDSRSVTLGLHKRKISLSGVEARRISLDSPKHFLNDLKRVQPGCVIHTAGLTNVEECEAKPEKAHYANVVLAENVARACAEFALPLVHISTDHLFSGRSAQVAESEPIEPQNQYARTKAEGEIRVLDLYPDAIVARTNFYGWGPSYRASFSDSIISALSANKPITLFEDVYYTPILIEVLARTLQELLNRRERGIFHITGDDRISKVEMGLKIAEQFGLDTFNIKSAKLAERKGLVRRPLDMSLSNKKVCRLLGRSLGGVREHTKALYLQRNLSSTQELRQL